MGGPRSPTQVLPNQPVQVRGHALLGLSSIDLTKSNCRIVQSLGSLLPHIPHLSPICPFPSTLRGEIRGYLEALENAGFLKPTDTDGIWEFNMVERDVVYKVVPHYQRRRLHAQLAQVEHTQKTGVLELNVLDNSSMA